MTPIAGGASFCWMCRRNLGGHSQKPGSRSWAVVLGPDGNEYRVHKKQCKRIAEQDGAKFLRDEKEQS